MFVCMYLCVRVCVGVSVSKFVCLRTCFCVSEHNYVCVRAHQFLGVCTCVSVCVCVYLAGQLSGGGDDESPEAQIGWLLEVGQQGETEGQGLP